MDLSINTNDDNLNDQGFQITSAGTLGDTYTSGEFSPDDWNFDTVFEGKVSINEKGWSMEMKIPYSATSFSKKRNSIIGALNFQVESMPEFR